MARRPEKDRSRGRRPEAPLGWIKQPTGQPAAEPEAAQPTPMPLSRRAARAQREAQEQEQQALLSGPPPPASPTRSRASSIPARPSSGGPDSRAKSSTPTSVPGPRRRRVAIWLTVAALLLAAWSATIFLDSGNVVLAGLASLAPLVTLIAVPVIAVGVGSRHLVAAAIAAVAALLPWSIVTGYLTAGPGRTTVGSDATLRVMSVDGAHGRASAQDIVRLARLYTANIVVVTQLDNQLTHDLTVDGLGAMAPSQWVTDGGSGNGTGIWSDQRIDDLRPISDLSRPGVDGTIEAGGSRIGITVVQLDGEPMQRSPSWHRDLTRLARHTGTVQPGFIVGDLNAGPWTPAFRKLTSAGWRDAPDVVGHGLRPTWPSWAPIPLTPLDHLLVSSHLGVTSADTLKVAGSENRALIVTLIVPQSTATGD